jgi:hypothetical protein
MRSRFGPSEADSELIVYSNAVLSFPIAFKRFKSIAWRHSQIFQFFRHLQLPDLSKGNTLEINKLSYPLSFGKQFCVWALERNNHAQDSNVER